MDGLQTVKPNAIRSTLGDIWNAKTNKNKVCAALYNLIFFTKTNEREEYIRKVASKLLEKFPARIFFISSDKTKPEDLQISVGVMSTKQGAFEVTCDLIEISSFGVEENQIPLLILPHLIPDLPVFLVWSDDPAQSSTLYEELKQVATRIIFDSETASDLISFAKVVIEKEESGLCEIGDLNWARLSNWRSLIGSTFKDHAKVEKIQNLSSITIEYNGEETPFFCHTKIQAVYLQAWILARLQLPKTQKVVVSLQKAKKNHLPPGIILSLEMKTEKNDRFFFSRDEKHPHQICFELSTNESCALPVYTEVSKGESGQSLVKEICHKGTSQHYIEVLKKIIEEGSVC